MRNTASRLVIFLLLCSGSRITAQENGYFLQIHINGQNGLPQNTIRDLAISNSGYMWLGTEDGLVRFDGRRTKIFNTQNSGLTKNRIVQLVKTDDGKLHCLTEENDLYEIIENDGPVVSIQFVSKIPAVGVSGYHLFKAANLSRFLNVCKIILPENYDNVNMFSVFILKEKNLLAQRCREGLLIFSKDLELQRKITIPNQQQADFFIYGGLLYMHFKGLFSLIDVETGKTAVQKIKNNIIPGDRRGKITSGKIIWNEKTEDVFYSTGRELYKISIEKEVVIPEKILDNLPDYPITKIACIPIAKSIFVGTSSNGVYVYRKKQFSTILSASSDNNYYAQAKLGNEGTVLTGNMEELGRNYSRRIPQLGAYSRNSLYGDSNNTIWFSNNDTLKYVDILTSSVKTAAVLPASVNNHIYVITSGDTGSLLIATRALLFSYKSNSGFQKIGDFNFPSSHNQPYCILKESEAVSWIGTSAGLYKYNQLNGRMLPVFNKLRGVVIRSLFITSSGLLLAGTYGDGIYAIKQNKLIKLPLDRNENLKAAHCFREDKSGFIWISSNNGLYKINLRQIDDYTGGNKNADLFYYRFSNTDGLASNEFNGGCFPCSISVDSNTWSFPSIQGLVWFQPDSMHAFTGNTYIYIDKIIMNDTVAVPYTPTIFTQTHKFKLNIYLSSPNWSDENNLQLQYNLETDAGSGQWVLLKDVHEPIVLQNLSGGSHKLVIRKKSGESINTIKELRLAIKVPFYVYERNWFWPAVGAAGSLFVWALVKIISNSARIGKEKTRRLSYLSILEKQNIRISNSEQSLKAETELKTTLLFLLTHDIASPLRHINLFLSRTAHGKEPALLSKEDLMDLTISTGNLEHLLDNIVSWIKSHENSIDPVIVPVNLHILVQEKIILFALAAQKKQTVIINNIEASTIVYTDGFIIAMALQNLLGNAINYTRNGTIKIDFTETQQHFEITVIDSGTGIPVHFTERTNDSFHQVNYQQNQSLQGYGIGLKIAAKLLALIQGRVSIQPADDYTGTMAVLYVEKV